MQEQIINAAAAAGGAIDIAFWYKADGILATEKISCKKVSEGAQVKHIPFQVRQLALGDIISFDYDNDDNRFYFSKKIVSSGNSTIRIRVVDLRRKEALIFSEC